MRIWLWKYTFLVTSGYGHDESAPTPGGMFATNFVGVRHVIADRQQHYRKPFVTYFVCVRCAFVG